MASALYLGNALVHFKSKIIPQVMQAVSDAETISQVYAVNKALQIRNLLLELKIPTSVKIKCLQDNKAAIITASNNKYGGKASWMKPPYYFLRETAVQQLVQFVWTPTKLMTVDVLTKPTSPKCFREAIPLLVDPSLRPMLQEKDLGVCCEEIPPELVNTISPTMDDDHEVVTTLSEH